MKNMEQIDGVNYDFYLLARLQIQRKRQPKEVEREWIKWRTQLLLGNLRQRNPVQINSEIFRQKAQCKP
jgi:hypothetical protein